MVSLRSDVDYVITSSNGRTFQNGGKANILEGNTNISIKSIFIRHAQVKTSRKNKDILDTNTNRRTEDIMKWKWVSQSVIKLRWVARPLAARETSNPTDYFIKFGGCVYISSSQNQLKLFLCWSLLWFVLAFVLSSWANI